MTDNTLNNTVRPVPLGDCIGCKTGIYRAIGRGFTEEETGAIMRGDYASGKMPLPKDIEMGDYDPTR